MTLELEYYRPFHRADLTDHATPGVWRFGVADGVVDCDDLAYFLNYAHPGGIVDKADFTTHGTTTGQSGYGAPDGLVTSSDLDYYRDVLFPAAHPAACPP